jgi:hypothetical protein
LRARLGEARRQGCKETRRKREGGRELKRKGNINLRKRRR